MASFNSKPKSLTTTIHNTDLASNPSFIRSMFVIVRASAKASPLTFEEESAYNFEDITVVGGAAYNVFRIKSKKMPEMKTRDIDMVWWTPKKVNNDVINSVVKKFRATLLHANRVKQVQDNLKHIIKSLQKEPIHIEIHVSEPVTHLKGGFIVNSTLRLSIIIDGIHIKNICEIVIHNGVSSQGYHLQNSQHNIMAATVDPIYCNRNEDYTMLISTIRVPTVDRYIEQQLFAYTRLRSEDPTAESIAKSNICLDRALHLRNLNDPDVTTMIDKLFSEAITTICDTLIKEQPMGIASQYIKEVTEKVLDLQLNFEETMDAITACQ